MAVSERLSINQKVEIVIEKGPYKGSYLSKVAEIDDGTDTYKVIALFLKGEIVSPRINQAVKISFNGDNALYEFNAIVIERLNKPIALLVVRKIGQVTRIQRRDYFRLDVMCKISYRILNDDKTDKQSELISTITVDMSAGGLKISVDEKFPKEGMLEIYIDLPEIENIPIYGKIVNEYDLPDGKAVGIEFIEIAQNEQDKIVSWLFDYQRKLRKRGLL